jgi:hypothetical protein
MNAGQTPPGSKNAGSVSAITFNRPAAAGLLCDGLATWGSAIIGTQHVRYARLSCSAFLLLSNAGALGVARSRLSPNYTEREDGSRADTFGPNPIGIVRFGSDGRLSLQEPRADMSKFASNNRQEGTPEENKAIVQGSICYFGTYTLDEAAKTLTFHLGACSFPNWTRTDQQRSFTLTGDELAWSGLGSSGRPVRAVEKRAR